MDGRIPMSVSLVFIVWCSIIDAGGFLMVVTAQPTASAYITKPKVGPIMEGDQVKLGCAASNLQSNHTVEWSAMDPLPPLMWDKATGVANNGRFFLVVTNFSESQVQFLDFCINSVLRGDAGDYVCTIYEQNQTGDRVVVSSSSVTLAVFYFPNESFPMCSPAGPISVDAGTQLDLTCTSESSHGTVTMMINPTTQTTRYTAWTSVINDEFDTVVSTLNLTVTGADNGIEFECIISSMIYADNSPCKIGPLIVREKVIKTTPDPETSTSSLIKSSTSSLTTPLPLPSSSAVVVGVAAGGIAAFLLIVILIFICRKRRSGISHPKSQQSNSDINQTNTQLTLDRLEHSQISFNNHGENLDGIPEGLQDNHKYENRISSPGDSSSNRAEATDGYEKPNRTQRAVHETTQQQPDLSLDSTAEQSYTNPEYDSCKVSGGTTLPCEDDLYASIKPMDLVKPFDHTEPETSTPL